MAILLLAGDGAAIAAIEMTADATAQASAGEAPTWAEPKAAAAPDEGWAVCQIEHAGRAVSPVSAAVTYLDAGRDRALTVNDVAPWLGDLDRSSIDVWKLETVQGERRVSFEVTRARWARWDEVAGGKTGKDVCSAVRGELRAHGVGRPRGAEDDGLDEVRIKSRHDFELIYARRPALYRRIEWAGTLDGALGEVEFAMLQRWLETGK